jgi:hypothetical protein
MIRNTMKATTYKLCVTAADVDKNDGTKNDVKLTYYVEDEGIFKCTLSGGIARGEEECCTATQYSDEDVFSRYTLPVEKQLKISLSGSDGLRVTGVRAGNYHYDHFYSHEIMDMDMDGYLTKGTCWKRFWIDSDDHKKCSDMLVNMRWPFASTDGDCATLICQTGSGTFTE